MVPIALLCALTLEIGGYLLLGRWLFQADWAYAIGGAIGGLLGIRAGINTITWVFALVLGSPAARMSSRDMLRMMAVEYLAFLRTFVLTLPFERLWMGPDRLKPHVRPVLLVHGYGCSRGVWVALRRRLESEGQVVATLSLSPPYTSLGKMVPQLAARIEAVCQATGAKQVSLVAHSMGGLICRSYLARHGREKVARLITISTPHQGTALARLGLGRNAREMEPGSQWLSDMADQPTYVPTFSLRNPYDNYVMPQDNQKLPGTRDIELPPTGHIAQLYDPRIADQICRFLED